VEEQETVSEENTVHIQMTNEKVFFGAVPLGRHITNQVTIRNISVDADTGAPRAVTVLIYPNSAHVRVSFSDPNRGDAPTPPPPSPTHYLYGRPQSAPGRLPTAPPRFHEIAVRPPWDESVHEQGEGGGGGARDMSRSWNIRPHTDGATLLQANDQGESREGPRCMAVNAARDGSGKADNVRQMTVDGGGDDANEGRVRVIDINANEDDIIAINANEHDANEGKVREWLLSRGGGTPGEGGPPLPGPMPGMGWGGGGGAPPSLSAQTS